MIRFGMGVLALGLMTGCAAELRTGGNIGGANSNGKRAGNVPGGIAVKNGDIAISPNGAFYVTLRGGQVVSGTVDQKDAHKVNGLPAPDRIAFFEGNANGFFVFSTERSGPLRSPTGVQKLAAYDRSADRVLWTRSLDGRKDRKLDVTQDGSRVILTGNTVLVMDAATGNTVTELTSEVGFKDLAIIAGGTRAVVVEDTQWETGLPQTRLSVRDTQDGSEVCHTQADNCSSEVAISEDESRVFLAPTLCAEDPVTVMNISDGNCEVEKQMPGFGPVAMSPNGGNLVVAFLDRDAHPPAGTTVPDSVRQSRQRYHLMLIDQATLEFTTLAVGNELPRYTFTPDGQRLLVDTPMDLLSGIKVLDLASHTFTNVAGPPVKLNSFTVSPDSLRAYITDAQLFDLDIASARLRPVGFGMPPDGVNLTPNGATLLVTQISDRVLMFFDASRVRETGRVYY